MVLEMEVMVDREMEDNPIGEDQTIEEAEMDFKIEMVEGQVFRKE